MLADSEDNIAAIATPAGRAALGIVRLSGKTCFQIVSQVFVPRSGNAVLPFRPSVGKIRLDGDRFLDEAVLTYFEKPHSYTREDLVEITCHGNPLILEEVLGRILSAGARLARPGEFTYRAFLNGRMDLLQAEAVQDLITADSIYQAELALQQLGGKLSARLHELREKFLKLVALMEGNIDFSEEQHYHFIDSAEGIARLRDIQQSISDLLGTFERGRLIREGFRVALVGRPNVGKSCLFNNLLGQDRAIVNPLPGTTRDYISERLTLGNHAVYFVDTAGIRQPGEEVENEGIQRSLQVSVNADLILFVLDGSRPLMAEDYHLWELIKERETVAVCNKMDLAEFRTHQFDDKECKSVSSLTGSGVAELMEVIKRRVEEKVRFSKTDSLITSYRHRQILLKTMECVQRASEALEANMSEEFALVEVYAAMRAVGELTGEVTVDDIYQEIFANFCIGK
ncbi:MAG TPA: tRNA uridine-5-carboxymethylaminomethyl(34) synthesis GTPase MnmE [Acidobacteriota bacterium]